MNIKKTLITILVFFLCSCSSNLQKLAKQEPKMKLEGYFSSYLALEYLDFSRSLLEKGNFLNSEYFAKKGIDASKGYKVILENPRWWHVKEPLELEDMISAQTRYERIYIPLTREKLPVQLAHLTFLYDCWIVNETKPAYRMGELSRCKVRFYSLLKEVEDFVDNYGKKTEPKTKIEDIEFERYFVFFDFDIYKINEKANRQIVNILNRIDELEGDYCVVLMGNADRSGKNLYNENLSLNRANAVKKYMRKNGVPEHLFDVRPQGEEFPDIITKDRIKQQYNRTVQVYLVRGAKSVRDIPLPVLKNIAYKQEIEREKKKRGW
jgi:outer membrane protein OmpA-like peptidoglycan-associated protein